MKKVIIAVLIALPITSMFAGNAFASSASSTINSNIESSSSNGDSQTTSHTDITVETDGKVTHYSSDEPNKDIHVESNNGVSKIEVNGQEVSGDSTEESNASTSPTPTQQAADVSFDYRSNPTFLENLFEELKKPFEITRNIIFFWVH